MKRFVVLIAVIGSAVAGFLWWKRKEVSRAGEISRDPWPSVINETRTEVSQESAAGSATAAE